MFGVMPLFSVIPAVRAKAPRPFDFALGCGRGESVRARTRGAP
jgi:hypothetical protein